MPALSVFITAGASPVSNQEDFLRYAEECRMLVEDGDVAAHRTSLESMARAWRLLAAEEERIADLVREVDHLFSAPGEAVELAMRRAGEMHKRTLRQH
jgi:hypothetical protein